MNIQKNRPLTSTSSVQDAVLNVVAPRATTKKIKGSSPSTSSGLIFEASNRPAVGTEVIGRVRATTVEVAVTCVIGIYRTTPVVTAAAHIVERTIAAVAVTWNGKLHRRTRSRSTIGNACRSY